tara:strand:- start:189 stop:542 length:354 start_codon:yes stop_codon:yes gene_type:complete
MLVSELGAAVARTSVVATGFNSFAGSGAGAAVAAGAAAVVEDELEAAVVEDELEAAAVVELEAAALEDSSSPLHATISITAISPRMIVTLPPRSDRTIMIPPQSFGDFRQGKYRSTL